MTEPSAAMLVTVNLPFPIDVSAVTDGTDTGIVNRKEVAPAPCALISLNAAVLGPLRSGGGVGSADGADGVAVAATPRTEDRGSVGETGLQAAASVASVARTITVRLTSP
ncbi:MAG TPA: hypothetical protein VKR24_10845 [Candidatus Limnocylindrales bacterium]|nr:hypothetical protein [Candidatus Limnocylindrales bacterium]